MKTKNRMMKLMIIGLSLLIVFALAACGSDGQADVSEDAEQVAESGDNSQEAESGDPAKGSGNVFSGELPKSMQLMFGTFYLEDTDQAVTPGQASEMLLLWKAVRSLSDSETVAAEELDALYDQIAESMTAEQLAVLEGVEFTREDQAAFMEAHGISMGAGNREASTDGESGGFVAPPEGMGGGGPGGGQGGGPGGAAPENMTPEQMETMQAMRESGAGRNMLTPAVFDALIELLEARAAG